MWDAETADDASLRLAEVNRRRRFREGGAGGAAMGPGPGPVHRGGFSMAVVQAKQVLEDQSQVESGLFGTFVGVYMTATVAPTPPAMSATTSSATSEVLSLAISTSARFLVEWDSSTCLLRIRPLDGLVILLI